MHKIAGSNKLSVTLQGQATPSARLASNYYREYQLASHPYSPLQKGKHWQACSHSAKAHLLQRRRGLLLQEACCHACDVHGAGGRAQGGHLRLALGRHVARLPGRVVQLEVVAQQQVLEAGLLALLHWLSQKAARPLSASVSDAGSSEDGTGRLCGDAALLPAALLMSSAFSSGDTRLHDSRCCRAPSGLSCGQGSAQYLQSQSYLLSFWLRGLAKCCSRMSLVFLPLRA